MTNPSGRPVDSSESKLLQQLNRIRGQVDGIISMYKSDRGCVEVVRQVIAVRNSLSRVASDLLSNEAKRCSEQRRVEDLDEILKEVFKYH